MDWKPAIESPEAVAALILTVGGLLPFWWAKIKDRVAAINKEKFEQYKDFMKCFSEFITLREVYKPDSEEYFHLMVNFAIQCNRVITFSSENVLNKLRDYNECAMMNDMTELRPIKLESFAEIKSRELKPGDLFYVCHKKFFREYIEYKVINTADGFCVPNYASEGDILLTKISVEKNNKDELEDKLNKYLKDEFINNQDSYTDDLLVAIRADIGLKDKKEMLEKNARKFNFTKMSLKSEACPSRPAVEDPVST